MTADGKTRKRETLITVFSSLAPIKEEPAEPAKVVEKPKPKARVTPYGMSLRKARPLQVITGSNSLKKGVPTGGFRLPIQKCE